MKTKIRKKELVSLDIDAAGMLAIDYLADKYGDDSSFNLIDAHSFNIIDINGMMHNREGSLEANPHNYYVFTFDIADKVIVLNVRSTGEIRILESFEVCPYGILNWNEYAVYDREDGEWYGTEDDTYEVEGSTVVKATLRYYYGEKKAGAYLDMIDIEMSSIMDAIE